MRGGTRLGNCHNGVRRKAGAPNSPPTGRSDESALRFATFGLHCHGRLTRDSCPRPPKMVIPKAGRARAVVGEGSARMIAAVPKARSDDATTWIRYLRGFYLGGLRLEESLALSWDDAAPFAVAFTGRHPAFRINATAQKARRDERLPSTMRPPGKKSKKPAGAAPEASLQQARL